MSKGQADHRIDEFAFILLGGVMLLIILTIGFLTPSGALIVSPDSINLVMTRGQTKVIPLIFNGTATNVTITAKGEVGDWFTFSRQQFDVNGREAVDAIIKVPVNIREGYHFGTIEIERTGETKRISVSINVTRYPAGDITRTIFFDDFKVSYLVGPETVDSMNNFEISKSYLSENSATLVGIIDQDKLNIVTDGFIRLVVESKNDAGDLIIIFNDKEVFKQNPGYGEVIVPISKDMIKRSNVVQIKADNPGLKFWMSNVYRFRTAEFGINVQGISFKDLTFNLDENDITNFKFGKISFKVTDYNPNALNDLIIKINDNLVYKGAPSLGAFPPVVFDKNKAGLNTGENILSFSVESEAFYQLTDVRLVIVKTGQ